MSTNLLWNYYAMAYNLENFSWEEGWIIDLSSLPPKCILASSPYLFQWFFLVQANHSTIIPILFYSYRNLRIHFAFEKVSGCKGETRHSELVPIIWGGRGGRNLTLHTLKPSLLVSSQELKVVLQLEWKILRKFCATFRVLLCFNVNLFFSFWPFYFQGQWFL